MDMVNETERKMQMSDDYENEKCVHRGEHYHGCDGQWYCECRLSDKDVPSDECGREVCKRYEIKEGKD